MEAFTVAIRSDDGVVVADQNRCPLELRYPADTLIRLWDIAPPKVIDSDAGYIHPLTVLENILQVRDAEVASRNALLRVL